MKIYKLGSGRPLTKGHINNASKIHRVVTNKGAVYAINISGNIVSRLDYWFDSEVIDEIRDEISFEISLSEAVRDIKNQGYDGIESIYWKCRIEHNGEEITECFLYSQHLTIRINIDITSIPNDIKELINKKVELDKTDNEGVYTIFVQTDGKNYGTAYTVYTKDKAEAELYAEIEAYRMYKSSPMKTMAQIAEELGKDEKSKEVIQEFWDYADKFIRFGAEKQG